MMLWHCGLLNPGENRTLSLIRRRPWYSLPVDVQVELKIWLAMPGFSNRYHAEVFGQDPRVISSFKGGYKDYKAQVIENWLSATREDCIKLCYLRPNKGHIPLIAQLQMRRDYARRNSQKEIVAEYMVSPYLVNQLAWGLPEAWFKRLPPEVIKLIEEDPEVNW